ncbi:MAG: zf-HC2 domain-containing protein [Gemmatimonadales bacterium]
MEAAELAAYLDGALDQAERERIQGHLAECDACREDLVSTSRIIRRHRARPAIGLAAGLTVAVAALVLWVAFDADPAPPIRDLPGGAGILVHGPVGPARRAGLRLAWGPVARTASYRVTVTDVGGSTVWTTSTLDTVVAVPDSIALRSDLVYYWVTDALLGDGTSRSTGLREFRLTR